MGNRSAADLKSSVLAEVSVKREKVFDKRKKRRTLADEVSLIDQAWRKVNPFGIKLARDRKLIKSQVILPLRSTDIDPVALAEWVVTNWDAIGAIPAFAKSKYPAKPVVPWFIACIGTYVEAYENKDGLDLTMAVTRSDVAKQAKSTQETAKALQSTAKKFETEQKNLRAQLHELEAENQRLREGSGKEDDDPVYRRVRKVAKRKTKIGKFD